MSRTYRDHIGCEGYGRWYMGITNFGHDCKPGGKPPGWYKRLMRRIRRARAKMAMRNGKEPPIERGKTDHEWWG